MQLSHLRANKRKAAFVQVRASQRIAQRRQKKKHAPVKPSKKSGKKRKLNYVDNKFVQTKPKPKKTRRTRNSSSASPSPQTAMNDLPHSHAEDEFHLWFDLKNDGDNRSKVRK